MILWKAASITMRKTLQSSFKLLLCIGLSLSLISCSQTKPSETLVLGQWLDAIVNKLSIQPSTHRKPYFINVDASNPYFESVQSSVDWGIVEVDSPFDPNEILTKEWCAATLVRLAQLQPSHATFNDANKSQFADLVQTSINFGLFTLDKRNCFNPTQVMDKREALALLDKTISYIDTKDHDEVNDFQFNDTPIESIEPIEFDEQNQTAVVDKESNLQKDDIVAIKNQNNNDQLYQIQDVKPSDNPNYEQSYEKVILGPVDYFEVVEESEFVYDEPLSFDDTIIEFDEGEPIEPVSYVTNKIKTHQKTFDGFTVKARFSGSNITIDLKKELDDKIDFVGTLKVYNIKPIVIWKTNKRTIEHAKFELRFDSVQSASLRYTPYQVIKEADLDDINRDNFIDKLTKNYKDVTRLSETLIPIGTIKVPLPNFPAITIGMQIYLRIGTNGRMELKIANDHSFGFEIKNNSMRLLNDHDHDVDFTLSGNALATAGIKAGVSAWNMELMDIGCDGGVRGKASLTVHCYDDNLNHKKSSVEGVDGELASLLSNKVDDVLTCIDLGAYYSLTLLFNSKDTVLSRIGFSKRIELLNQENAPLIKGLTMHLEDGIKVSKCTRGSKTIHKVDKNPLQNYEKITLSKYSYVLDKASNHQIEIKGIPNDITYADLVYESSDPTIASVNQKGIITAHNEGACHIMIKDNSAKYETTLNIIVRMAL